MSGRDLRKTMAGMRWGTWAVCFLLRHFTSLHLMYYKRWATSAVSGRSAVPFSTVISQILTLLDTLTGTYRSQCYPKSKILVQPPRRLHIFDKIPLLSRPPNKILKPCVELHLPPSSAYCLHNGRLMQDHALKGVYVTQQNAVVSTSSFVAPYPFAIRLSSRWWMAHAKLDKY